MGQRGTRKRSKSYNLQRRKNRRLEKRSERRKGKTATEVPHPAQESLLEAERNTQEEALDRVGDEALADRSADKLLSASQQAIETLKADYERLRKLLWCQYYNYLEHKAWMVVYVCLLMQWCKCRSNQSIVTNSLHAMC